MGASRSVWRSATFAAAFGLLIGWSNPSQAHDFAAPADSSGFPIAAIDHGAMEAIAPFRDRILRLAKSVRTPDERLSALLFHTQMQSANCFWSLLPGSLTDEQSPMNACAHADMAGLKAILTSLLDRPDTAVAADAIRSDLDVAMVRLGTAFVRCEFSQMAFNTASQITPPILPTLIYLAQRSQLQIAVSMFVLGLTVLIHRLRKGRARRPHLQRH